MVQFRIVTQFGEDLVEILGSEHLDTELAVFVGKALDLIQADLMDLAGLKREGREALYGPRVHGFAIAQEGEPLTARRARHGQHLVAKHIAVAFDRRSNGVADDVGDARPIGLGFLLAVRGRWLGHHQGVGLDGEGEPVVELADHQFHRKLRRRSVGGDPLAQTLGDIVDGVCVAFPLLGHYCGNIGVRDRQHRGKKLRVDMDPEDGIGCELGLSSLLEVGIRLDLIDQHLAGEGVGLAEAGGIDRPRLGSELAQLGDI